MKITIYELLGMIKDGKAPKGVKSEGHYYTYNELEKDYYEGMGYDYEYLIKNTPNDRLNDEVEILEEEKKIPEKIQWHEDNGVGDEDDAFYVDVNNKSQYVHSEYDSWEMTVILTINKIIDYLKSKGE